MILSKKTPQFNHIAIIMDGNGRWAKKHSLSKKEGHKAGIENAVDLIKKTSNQNLTKNLTLYVFSTENWLRPVSEVRALFELIESTYKAFQNLALIENISINHLGRTKKIPKKTLGIINETIKITNNNNGLILNLAFNYGGRSEIIDAINKQKKIKSEISEKNFSKLFYNPKLPDPEIIIRTGGDIRLSNFLLWQSAYSELFFVKTLWPDFKIFNLHKIINAFNIRKRNFGK